MGEKIEHTRCMKKTITLLLSVTLATGIASPAFAQHCTVQKGDSIWRIAKEYHLDFNKLLELNEHLKNPHLIHREQRIVTHEDSGKGNTNEASSEYRHDQENDLTSAETGASESQARQVLDLVNAERSRHGLRALTLDNQLNEVAAVKAKDMADNNYFSHDSPTYGSPFDMMHRFGIDYQAAGENIAAGQRSAKEVMESWMNSSGHRANILSQSYTNLGVGYYQGGSYGTYWVQEFTK